MCQLDTTDLLLTPDVTDEPHEVIVVKKALTEHLDMDPKVTLGVLCDQVSPPNEPMDDEEQNIRDRLRSLVLSFLTGEAKRAIVERHAIPGSVSEKALIDSLHAVRKALIHIMRDLRGTQAIPKLNFTDVEVIVKDLLLSLPAFKARSRYGPALVELLLEKVSSSLRTVPRSSDNLLSYLDLLAVLVVERHTAPAIQLLRFYCSNLSSKITLQKLGPSDRTLVICNMVETFDATNNATELGDDGQQLDVLTRQLVDASPFLLEVSTSRPIAF